MIPAVQHDIYHRIKIRSITISEVITKYYNMQPVFSCLDLEFIAKGMQKKFALPMRICVKVVMFSISECYVQAEANMQVEIYY